MKKFDRLFMLFLLLCFTSVIPFIVSLETTLDYFQGIGKPSYIAITTTIGLVTIIYIITKVMFHIPPTVIKLRHEKIKKLMK